MSPVLAITTLLTDADRCDRCGSRAYVKVVFASGDLLFCGHHGHRFELRLREVAREFHDETNQLLATAATAPTAARERGPAL